MKKDCIIFGCGNYGNLIWYKLREAYRVAAYADNDRTLWGKEMHGIPVIAPGELYGYPAADIFIAAAKYEEIADQLDEMGIRRYKIFKEGFLYDYDSDRVLRPIRESAGYRFSKRDKDRFEVLFVQRTACIRTHKIAAVLKKYGFGVSLAYTLAHPEMSNREFADIYDNIYPINTMDELIELVDGSEFDIVHSSNEPDYLTNLLLCTNKKIVHDTHDMSSLRPEITIDRLAAEYLANTGAHGVIYISEGLKEVALEKYAVAEEKIFVFENLMTDRIRIEHRHGKLSRLDGEIHCVYEGGISPDRESHRYFEDIWKRLTEEGIHIHFYSNQKLEYCRELEKKSEYLHYEGNLSSVRLATEMTKYDCGLALFHATRSNRIFLDTGSTNKIYEYINAGLPIIVGDLKQHTKFVQKYGGGIILDFTQPILPQLKTAAAIQISETFLEDNSLLMEQRVKELAEFYQRISRSR